MVPFWVSGTAATALLAVVSRVDIVQPLGTRNEVLAGALGYTTDHRHKKYLPAGGCPMTDRREKGKLPQRCLLGFRARLRPLSSGGGGVSVRGLADTTPHTVKMYYLPAGGCAN